MVCDRIHKSTERESHLSFSIMQMTGQITSITVTPVNHSIKSEAMMQGIVEETQGFLSYRSVKQEESWIYYGGMIKSKDIPFDFLLEEGKEFVFWGKGGGGKQSVISLCWRAVRGNMIFPGKEGLCLRHPQCQGWLCSSIWRTCAAKKRLGDFISGQLNCYSAHSLPTTLAPVGKTFYTTRKMKYAKYHKDI